MKKLSALRATAMIIGAAGFLALMTSSAQAEPPYCVGKGWDFANMKTGNNTADPLWDYYFQAYTDYNDCFGDFPCNDTSIVCTNPPV